MKINEIEIHHKVDKDGTLEITAKSPEADVSAWIEKAEIGRKIAREKARNKIWALEGYLLKQKLHEAA